MKRLIYSKFSNERARTTAIRTDILEENGKKTVRKTACYAEGIPHVMNIAHWYQRLSETFAQTKIDINVCKMSEEGAELAFLEGTTLDENLYQLWNRGKETEALAVLKEYMDIIQGKAERVFTVTPEFIRVFGEQAFSVGMKSMEVTDLDMVLTNILVGEKWNLIDYEWTFDFPIPVNFVLYRILHYFFEATLKKTKEQYQIYCTEAGISEEEIQIYEEMEQSFQRYVVGNHVPLRELYSFISEGFIDLTGDNLGVNYHPKTAFQSSLYYTDDGIISEEKCYKKKLFLNHEGDFSICFEFKNSGDCTLLRWDPLERDICRIRIDRICSEAFCSIEPLTGFMQEEQAIFWDDDPAFLIHGKFESGMKLEISGHLELINKKEILNTLIETTEKLNRTNQELIQYQNQYQSVSGELSALKSTKGFQSLEKMRTARNYAKHQVKRVIPGHAQDLPKVKTPYQNWFEAHQASKEELKQQRRHQFPYEPVISILVPTYRTPEKYLREMIESVKAQTYYHWELCIADGSCGDENVEQILEEYAKADSRIKYVLLDDNKGISENTNGAVPLATGDYIGLLDHDDVLAPNALSEVASALQGGQTDIVYTDEDKVNADLTEHSDPNLKPDFSIDLLRSHNYITHFFVVKSSIFHEVGGFRKEFDGAQDYDLMFRCIEHAKVIKHVPKVLYYWRMHSNSTAENPESKLYAYEAGRKVIEEHLKRCNVGGEVERMELWGMNHVKYHTPGNPVVSIIIPNKDHKEDLKLCIESILNTSTYKNVEIVVVENNSTENEIKEYYKELQSQYSNVKVVVWEKEFNYSAINNFGTQNASGDYFLFLNNDTELISAEGISEMLGCCMRKEVGCVGAKLLFADDTVQHAGIVLGFGGFAGHVFSGIGKNDFGFMLRPVINCNYSAVTAACMMVRKEVFHEMEGFTESFAVALNDIDFCMKIRKAGYLIVYNAFSLWHHYESKSRGYEDTPEKQERFQAEVKRFRNIWAKTVDAGDPYYNPNFSVNRAPFTLW